MGKLAAFGLGGALGLIYRYDVLLLIPTAFLTMTGYPTWRRERPR